jgi:hypothetical protein
MERKWKYWLGVTAVVLMAGAGCGQPVEPVPLIKKPFDLPRPAVQPETKTESPVDVDQVTDALIKSSDEDVTSALEENADADLMNNDSSELNAYGQAYDEADFR